MALETELLGELSIDSEATKLSDDALVESVQLQLEMVPPNIKTALGYAYVLLGRNLEDGWRWELFAECIYMLPDELREKYQPLCTQACIKAIELSPDSCAKACWYLGQESEGEEAYHLYEKAFLQLQDRAKAYPDSRETKEQFVEVCAALAELFMTDLCFHPDAEALVQTFIEAGLAVLPDALCVLVQKCAFLTVTLKLDEAKELALHIYSRHLLPYYRAFKDDDNAAAPTETDDPAVAAPAATLPADAAANVDVNDMPDPELQLNVARIMTDVGLEKEAIVVLQTLNELVDNDDRVYHRLALAYMLTGEFEFAKNSVEEAIGIRQARTSSSSGGEDDPMAELQALRTQIAAHLQ